MLVKHLFLLFQGAFCKWRIVGMGQNESTRNCTATFSSLVPFTRVHFGYLFLNCLISVKPREICCLPSSGGLCFWPFTRALAIWVSFDPRPGPESQISALGARRWASRAAAACRPRPSRTTPSTAEAAKAKRDAGRSAGRRSGLAEKGTVLAQT